MPRKSRKDEAGTHHHVFNRAIARRPMFENRHDMRFFCAQLVRAVRRGEIRILAFSLMTTHYHLLVRSEGRLAAAMQRIQTEYSRYFNRSRRRDGPLVRGRYASKRVRSNRYRGVLINYIDQNPVAAKLVDSPLDYEFGSARAYALRDGPAWLDRRWVTRVVRALTGSDPQEDGAYSRVFEGVYRDLSQVVEGRMSFAGDDEDPMDDLVGAAPERVLAWMREKAMLADGTHPGIPLVPRLSVFKAIKKFGRELDEVAISMGHPRDQLRSMVAAGLLRHLSGLRHREIALIGHSESAVGRILRMHQTSILRHTGYGAVCSLVANAALDLLPRLVQDVPLGARINE